MLTQIKWAVFSAPLIKIVLKETNGRPTPALLGPSASGEPLLTTAEASYSGVEPMPDFSEPRSQLRSHKLRKSWGNTKPGLQRRLDWTGRSACSTSTCPNIMAAAAESRDMFVRNGTARNGSTKGLFRGHKSHLGIGTYQSLHSSESLNFLTRAVRCAETGKGARRSKLAR